MMERIVCPFCNNTALFTYEKNRIYQLKCNNCDNTIIHEDSSYDNAKKFFERIIITDNDEIKVMQSELSEYKQKLADGRMIELPCKVGDTVYKIGYVCTKKCEHNIKGFCKIGITETKNGNRYCDKHLKRVALEQVFFRNSAILENINDIFLTKEDAEKALRERETHEN